MHKNLWNYIHTICQKKEVRKLKEGVKVQIIDEGIEQGGVELKTVPEG